MRNAIQFDALIFYLNKTIPHGADYSKKPCNKAHFIRLKMFARR